MATAAAAEAFDQRKYNSTGAEGFTFSFFIYFFHSFVCFYISRSFLFLYFSCYFVCVVVGRNYDYYKLILFLLGGAGYLRCNSFHVFLCSNFYCDVIDVVHTHQTNARKSCTIGLAKQQTKQMTTSNWQCPNNLDFWVMRANRANVWMASAVVVRVCWSRHYDNSDAWTSPIRRKIFHLNWKWSWMMLFYIRVEWRDEIRRPYAYACHDSVSSNCVHHFTICILSAETCMCVWKWELISGRRKYSIGMHRINRFYFWFLLGGILIIIGKISGA